MNESDFLKAIEADPCDPTPRLVYADWLDEQGNPRGELLRIQEELRHIEVPNRLAKEARMHQLLNEGVKPLMITWSNSFGMEFTLIFPGEFLMGSPETEEQRGVNEYQVAVTLTQPFYFGRVVVTQAEWFKVMRTTPWSGLPFVEEGDRYPACYVNCSDAMEFCATLTRELPGNWVYTIPTESQWEYCCRAGTTTRYSFGDDESKLWAYAWYSDNAHDIDEWYPHAVVSEKLSNGWGLYGMHGNLWEWCNNLYKEREPGASDQETTALFSSRMFRGGTWAASSVDCRSAARDDPGRGAITLSDDRGDLSVHPIVGIRLVAVPFSE